MRLPTWLYAWAIYHFEGAMVYGLAWFLRPRHLAVILVVLLLALLGPRACVSALGVMLVVLLLALLGPRACVSALGLLPMHRGAGAYAAARPALLRASACLRRVR